MGATFDTLAEAYGITVGDGMTKAVLIAFAKHACGECGLAWPGMKRLITHTEFGETRVRSSIKSLCTQGLLEIHRFPYGGRGLTTEYIVLPQFERLSTAPCAKCRENMKNPSPHEGNRSGKGSRGEGLNQKPLAAEAKRVRGGEHQLPENQNYHARERARRSESDLSAGREATSNSTPERYADTAVVEAARADMRRLGILPPPEGERRSE